MWEKIVAFFASIMAFFMGLFGMMPGTVKEYKNVSYGSASIQKMDVYYPNSPDKIEGETGAFILIHGGAWSAGSKENYTSLAKGIAQEGYIAATINYRMFQQGATYAEMLEDINLAIAKLKEKTESDGITVNKIAFYGDSAGGHLSLLYAYTHLNGTDTAAPIPVAFTVGRVAPVDFFDPFYKDNLNDETLSLLSHLVGTPITAANIEANRELIAMAEPLSVVTAAAPPTILCYGGRDTIVPVSNGLSMKAKLEELNVPHEWFYYENSGHGLDSGADSALNEQFLNTLREYAALYF
ncbi:MAG: alpha/beta hydrolase [Oscillospiraceae bacterium]|jgi:acetyl esterase/lipase|nr:alpha/beta hydrolase [Oscillospiraceae bacterium]